MSAEAATEPKAAAPVEETKAPATAAVDEPSSGTGEKRKADDEPEGQPDTKCVYPTRITNLMEGSSADAQSSER